MGGHILELDSNVERKRVVYKNRYGMDIAGEIYYEKTVEAGKKYPALIVGAPYGGVKEQGPCVYGNELAQKGFVVLTFDQSFMGESGGFTTTSELAMMNYRLLDYIGEISPRPILFVVGDRAHSRFFSEDAYKAAAEPKEIYVVEDAEHIDLYDRRDRIPFGKLAEFFDSAM